MYFYYAGAGRREEARRLIDQALARIHDDRAAITARALVLAWEGRHAEAKALLPELPPASRRRGQTYHHATYLRACVSALGRRRGRRRPLAEGNRGHRFEGLSRVRA